MKGNEEIRCSMFTKKINETKAWYFHVGALMRLYGLCFPVSPSRQCIILHSLS